MEQLARVLDLPVLSSDGLLLGRIDGFLFDANHDEPHWIVCTTATSRHLIPAAGANYQADAAFVAVAAEQVRSSPPIDGPGIGADTERALEAHYRVVAEPDTSLVRAEEELEIGTRDAEYGRLILRKSVETSPITMSVSVRREIARLTREPIGQVSPHRFSEEEITIPFHAQEPVARKQTIAKERIAIDKSVERVTVRVEDEVRKERIDVEYEPERIE
jgi:stress response protein YsnF